MKLSDFIELASHYGGDPILLVRAYGRWWPVDAATFSNLDDELVIRLEAADATDNGVVSTEWGLLYPEYTEDDHLRYPEPVGADDVDVSRDEAYARREAAYTSGIRVMRRQVRTVVGPWVVAS